MPLIFIEKCQVAREQWRESPIPEKLSISFHHTPFKQKLVPLLGTDKRGSTLVCNRNYFPESVWFVNEIIPNCIDQVVTVFPISIISISQETIHFNCCYYCRKRNFWQISEYILILHLFIGENIVLYLLIGAIIVHLLSEPSYFYLHLQIFGN